MAELKHEVLQHLWELEIRILENCPEAARRLDETFALLQREEPERTGSVRLSVGEARRLCDTGRKEDAVRELRRAIAEVKGWY